MNASTVNTIFESQAYAMHLPCKCNHASLEMEEATSVGFDVGTVKEVLGEL